MSAPELRTDRLLLRGWRDADRAPYAALNADPEVMEHFPATLDRAASDGHVDRVVAAWRAGDPSLWATEVHSTGEFIGFVGLDVKRFEAAFTPAVEVGWRLARSAWGHGYATEAAAAAIDWGFGEAGLEEIVSMTAVGNRRSRAVMERLGMTHDPAEDFDHPNVPEGHRVRRHVLYRLQPDDWWAARGR